MEICLSQYTTNLPSSTYVIYEVPLLINLLQSEPSGEAVLLDCPSALSMLNDPFIQRHIRLGSVCLGVQSGVSGCSFLFVESVPLLVPKAGREATGARGKSRMCKHYPWQISQKIIFRARGRSALVQRGMRCPSPLARRPTTSFCFRTAAGC